VVLIDAAAGCDTKQFLMNGGLAFLNEESASEKLIAFAFRYNRWRSQVSCGAVPECPEYDLATDFQSMQRDPSRKCALIAKL
jgi:hypothetical protein